ncbi:MAG: hypothetical protein ABI406_13230 [Ktedonobacteraceae bacterium]
MSNSDKHYQDVGESQKRDDDFEIEIIDLEMFPGESVPKSPDGSDERSGWKETMKPTSARISLRSRLTQRQRMLRIVGSATVIIVALLLILNSIVPVHALLGALAGPTPTATATLAPNIDHFYLDASPPWGRLTLDGHPLAFSTLAPVQLAPGHHQFVWRASPFQPVRCTLSVPVATTDTCKHITIAAPMNGTASTAQEVTFYDTLNMLSGTQQSALIQAAQAALDAMQSTTTVQPGEQFVHVVGNRTTDITTQRLRATLHFDLSVGDPELENAICANNYNSECYFLYRSQSQDATQNCDWFCTEPDTYTTLSVPNYWQTAVIAREYWDFATPDGHTIATDQPDTVQNLTYSAHFIYLNILWNGTGWQASFNAEGGNGYNPLACLAANDELYEIPPPVGIKGFGFSATPATAPAAGCLEIVQSTAASPSSSVPVSPLQAFCLYRFGIMLAANALAHRYWPSIPIANPYEQALAKQLATTQTP